MPDPDLHPDQATLFDDLDAQTVARATDPDTSHEAAAIRRGSRLHKMLSAFHYLHPRPSCWDAAAEVAMIEPQSSPWRLVTTLHKAGFIAVEGIGRTRLNSKAQAYLITEAGIEALQSR